MVILGRYKYMNELMRYNSKDSSSLYCIANSKGKKNTTRNCNLYGHSGFSLPLSSFLLIGRLGCLQAKAARDEAGLDASS